MIESTGLPRQALWRRQVVWVLSIATLLTVGWAVLTTRNLPQLKTPVSLEGTWYGSGWGTVTLEESGTGKFTGRYSSTYGKDVGRLELVWNNAMSRFEGTWGEGTYRFGDVWVRSDDDGKTFHGAWSAAEDCDYQPGDPTSEEFTWRPPVEWRSFAPSPPQTALPTTNRPAGAPRFQ